MYKLALLTVASLSLVQGVGLFKQCDTRWGSDLMGTSKEKDICHHGCLITCVAMALHECEKKIVGVSANPQELNNWLTVNGGYVNEAYLVYGTLNTFGMFYVGKTSSFADIRNFFNAGHIIFLNVNNGGHWVLLTGYAGAQTYQVNDPGHERQTYKQDEIVNSVVFTRPSSCMSRIIRPNINTQLDPLDRSSRSQEFYEALPHEHPGFLHI
jgi:hypothetical protein